LGVGLTPTPQLRIIFNLPPASLNLVLKGLIKYMTKIKREQFLDTSGRPLTQSLFLEIGYTPEAIYTLKEIDYKYNGKLFPSLKRLYLEASDPTEYSFATAHLLGWKHWVRICENKQIRKHVDEWREELEIKLRSAAVLKVMQEADKGTFQAAKWLADRGWDTRAAGRPSKLEKEKNAKIQEHIDSEYGGDVVRMFANQGT
jgi:hypothetical protein